MRKFNVLDRNLDIHQHYLLEASAGTGKTFSIQNIVVRLLIESSQDSNPLPIHKILVVTFTRAATRDLRLRIRANIEQALNDVNEWLNEKVISASVPDYLISMLEKGNEAAVQTKKYLQQALFAFDQAQIFTIHSFCARMLKKHAIESDIGFNPEHIEDTLPPSEVMKVIRDFFRTEIREEIYSPAQLAIFLKEDPEQKKLLKAIQSGYDLVETPTFNELHRRFCESIKKLKTDLNLNAETVLEDFKAQYDSYKNYKSGETKAETLAKVISFSTLFDKDEWTFADLDRLIKDGLVWVYALNPNLLKSRATAPVGLKFPQLTDLLKNSLEPIINQASNFSGLLARLASDCQRLLRRYQQEEEKLSPDDLLRKMDWALVHQPQFLKDIQSTYQAAIIDEFQDTDPLQWQIFKRIFLSGDYSWTGHLYLVGDPKQSIYSFRQADIYTYLAAAQALGIERCFSLDTNYRSQPSLVQALNTLFANEHVPKLIPLPKKDFYLPYHPVQASKKNVSHPFQDDREAVHFFIGDAASSKRASFSDLENHVFFPFIVQEIKNLTHKSNLELRQIAILVRDRYQALRLAQFLDSCKIPYVNQRGTSLAESLAMTSLIDVIRAVLHPYDIGAIKAALGGPLIAWTHEEIKVTEQLDQVLVTVHRLKEGLIEKGVYYFFNQLLHSCWLPDELTVLERLLSREGGLEFYHDLQQIVDIIIDHQYQEWNSPEGLVPFLDQLKIWDTDEDDRVKRFQDPSKNGVKILTLHVSKGLEFDVVFALGLVNRSGGKDDLIPIEKEGKMVLAPLLGERDKHRYHFEENDAEKMRQLYVAMTRAKYRLYIPAAFGLHSSDLKTGEASPIDLFLARLRQEPASYEELYDRIKNYDSMILTNFLDSIGKTNHITYSIYQKIDLDLHQNSRECSEEELYPPRSVVVAEEPLLITSFSSLSYSLLHPNQQETDQKPPHDFENEDKNVHTLPANHETGILLHAILEKIPFSICLELKSPNQLDRLIQPYLHLPKFKNWDRPISEILFNTLKTPLKVRNNSFCLADLSTSQLYKEMPFLFPYEGQKILEGIKVANGFIKGIVDLIFRYDNQYYIVDWKSNWLGSDERAYSSDKLHQTMVNNHYFLQASLYTEALRRYLKIVEDRSFEECFGGVFYLFMRGMQPGKESGIYTFIPSSSFQ